jgi:TetR/AcrR family transcriptional repressor of nem operon
VADISKEAGLTHGALYAQFSSKDELAAEALAYGAKQKNEHTRAVKDGDARLGDHLEHYLNKRHRDSLAAGCPFAASGSEVARQDKAVSKSFTEGFVQMAAAVEASLGARSVAARERALTIAAAEIGALIVARGVAKADPKLSEEILGAARRVLGEIQRPPRRLR